MRSMPLDPKIQSALDHIRSLEAQGIDLAEFMSDRRASGSLLALQTSKRLAANADAPERWFLEDLWQR